MTDKAQKLMDRWFLPRAELFRDEYLVTGTQRDMVKACGISIAAVNHAVKELEMLGAVSRMYAGVYILHLPIVWQGGRQE